MTTEEQIGQIRLEREQIKLQTEKENLRIKKAVTELREREVRHARECDEGFPIADTPSQKGSEQ